MKQISRLLFLSIFFASCASTPIPATATPVMTQTSAPTATLAFTDTPQPTPTETPDPNRPPGAIGQDEFGNYIKPWVKADGTPVIAENGTQLYETWVSVPVGPNGEMFNSWTEPHIKNPTLNGGIPVLEIPEYGFVPVMPISFFVKDGIQNVKFLGHILSPDKEGVDYAGQTRMILEDRSILDENTQNRRTTKAERVKFRLNYPDSLKIKTVDAQGNSHTLGGDTSFTIVLVDPSDIPNPDFLIGDYQGSSTVFASTFDDDKNTVTILVASTISVDQAPDPEDFTIRLVLEPIGFVLTLPIQSQEKMKAYPGKYPSPWILANMALKGDPPYFTLSDSP
jgi:hypothetical protein